VSLLLTVARAPTTMPNNDKKGRRAAQGGGNDDDNTENGIVKKSVRLLLVRHAESMNNQVYTDAQHLFKVGTPDYKHDEWKNYIRTHRKADPGLSDRGHVQSQILGDHLHSHLLDHASHPVHFIVSPMKRTILTIMPTLSKLESSSSRRDEGEDADADALASQSSPESKSKVVIHGFYFESEGCHLRGKPEEGMNPIEISELLNGSKGQTTAHAHANDNTVQKHKPQFEGFDGEGEGDCDLSKGWYADGTGPETREQSEERSAKFYLWLCDFLDAQIASKDDDVFDAGAPHPDDYDNHNGTLPIRIRQRRTCVLVGHGDFMGLLLKRIVAGFGHAVETVGVNHRSAFVHFNTGMTEVEYFGNGRFLVMGSNLTPHLDHLSHSNTSALNLKTGGSLKDGWSFIIPADEKTNLRNRDNKNKQQQEQEHEVTIHFSDELEDHVREQTDAMKHLYLSSKKQQQQQRQRPLPLSCRNNTGTPSSRVSSSSSALRNLVLSRKSSSEIDEASASPNNNSLISVRNLTFDYTATTTTGNNANDNSAAATDKTFVIRRGLQVIGCASFNELHMSLTDVVVRKSCRRQGVGTALVNSVRSHLLFMGMGAHALTTKDEAEHGNGNGTYLTVKVKVTPTSNDSFSFFEHLGFAATDEPAHAHAAATLDDGGGEAIHRMKCKL
jgi:broad specificity phosphatase PhoE/GNAT superfamily N-acetyltransferase